MQYLHYDVLHMYVCMYVYNYVQMPTCVYFLRGECTREVCPYRHVTVGEDAGICLDFARGHCPNGTQVSEVTEKQKL